MKHPAGDFYVIRNSYDRFGCQKVVRNLVDVKLHKAGTRFVTLGEN